MRRTDSINRPSFELESTLIQLGDSPVAGIDEAGRGPWAGPVVAAAVILNPQKIPAGIADSKTLNADDREVLFTRITETAAVAVAIAEPDRIDRINILNATLWAMRQAVLKLDTSPTVALIDGNRTPNLECQTRAIVKGDSKCLSIAAASIIAKVTRDRIMTEYAASFPGYGFERHKGYGTPEHKKALSRLGPTPIHRRSFKPVQLALTLSASA